MRLLKTVLLTTTLLMGSTVFASGDVPTELAAADKATQGFLDTVGKIKTEHETYLNVVNKQVKKLGGTEGDTFLKALGALKSSIDAVLTQQTTLETELATATGRVRGEATAAQEAIATKDAEIARVRAEATAAQEAIAAKDAEIARVRAEATAAQEAIATKDAEIARVRAEATADQEAIAAKDAEIARVRAEVEGLKASNQLLVKQMGDRAEANAAEARALLED